MYDMLTGAVSIEFLSVDHIADQLVRRCLVYLYLAAIHSWKSKEDDWEDFEGKAEFTTLFDPRRSGFDSQAIEGNIIYFEMRSHVCL